MKKTISNKNEIEMYLHCGLCLDEKPEDISPMDYQRIQAGWTVQGLQIWCIRHDCNILHIDFEGRKLSANTTRTSESKES